MRDGRGRPLVESGATRIGGVFEIINQLRGRRGARQVQNARIGLSHTLGAGGNCAVLLFERV